MVRLGWVFILTLTLNFQVARAQSETATNQRFLPDQIHFKLVHNSGEVIQCHHQLLSHIPYWRVNCDQREYTVNTWLQMLRSPSRDLSKVTLMFDVSEGVESSGEKLVQFRSHLSSFVFSGGGSWNELHTSLDVLNGQASLEFEAKAN